MAAILDKLIKEKPCFHVDKNGNEISWNSNLNLLRALENILISGMNTMEIGAGYSTVIFVNKRCTHTVITPSKKERDKITDYCIKSEIFVENVTFNIGQSCDLLPHFDKTGSYDLAFIDGAHRFPFPIIDWFYCARLLKHGGLIVIDDTDIINCHFLLMFMRTDPHWERVKIHQNYAIFRKLRDMIYSDDWPNQPFSSAKISNKYDLMKIIYSLSDYPDSLMDIPFTLRQLMLRIRRLFFRK